MRYNIEVSHGEMVEMKIKNLNDVPKTVVEMAGVKGAWRQLAIGSEDGTPVYSLRVFTLEPSGHTPFHTHPWEHVNYVIAGEGAIVDAAGVEHPFGAGEFAIVNPDEKHQYRNTSDRKPFMMICAVPKENE